MKPEYTPPFINAAVTTISTMAGTVPTPGEPFRKSDRKTYGPVTGVIGLGGTIVAGNMAISFDEPCILGIVSRMFLEECSAIDDNILDAVGELTNVIAGGVKRELAELGLLFDMATPLIVRGQGVEIAQFARAEITVMPFKTEFGSFVIESSLAPVDQSQRPSSR